MQNVSVPDFAPETILFDKDRRTNLTEENRNALMQRNDRLIRDVIQKAEKECKSAVALIAMYGSFCTGRYSETSDLDLFVLMRNEDGYKACVTFILDGIGMDFYGVKWEWLEEEANYTTPYLAKLLDSKIVYCPENADRERFEALREKSEKHPHSAVYGRRSAPRGGDVRRSGALICEADARKNVRAKPQICRGPAELPVWYNLCAE